MIGRFLLLPLLMCATLANKAPPIIDMHMHAWSLTEFGTEPPEVCAGSDGIDMVGTDAARPFDFKAQATCPHMLKAPATDAAVLSRTLG